MICYKLLRTILDVMLAINNELKRDYNLKELFLDIINNSDYKNAEKDMLICIDLCNKSKITEFIKSSKTTNNRLPYIVHSFINKCNYKTFKRTWRI